MPAGRLVAVRWSGVPPAAGKASAAGECCRACPAQVGIHAEVRHLPASASQREVEQCLQDMCSNPSIDGVLVQLPLPPHVNEEEIIGGCLCFDAWGWRCGAARLLGAEVAGGSAGAAPGVRRCRCAGFGSRCVVLPVLV